MKKVWVILLIVLLISFPVSAFSIKDFLINFKEIFTRTAGSDINQFVFCTQGQLRCGGGNECSGYPCVMSCQNNAWTEYQYCAYQCSNGTCINNQNINNPNNNFVCNENEVRCSTGNECSGNPCVMSCQNNAWTEYQYCAYQCSNGQCINNNQGAQEQCQDGTQYNQCSNNKPYFCSNGILILNCNTCGCPAGTTCNSNQCVQIIQGPYDPGGDENERENNQDLLNAPPVIISVNEKTLKKGENINFRINAIDSDRDVLTYKIDSTPEITRCSINLEEITCAGINPGEGMLKISVSDGKDSTAAEIKIKVLDILKNLQKGVAAGLANTPPVADAGSDIVSIPGASVTLDASLSYDKEGLLSTPETFKWYKDNNLLKKGKTIQKSFALGSHKIKLIVTDSEGLTSEDEINIKIKEKTTCKSTKTVYYPEDTICNNKWPIKEGSNFKINSLTEGSCGLFEVCSEDIDYIIKDSIDCCTNSLTDPEKVQACNFANENSKTFKNCQAVYIIKSLGKPATYMHDYLDAEMCCKGVEALCPKTSYLYTPQPIPDHLKGVKCSNTQENNPNGYWASDTKLDLNEIALFDAPAHASLNIIKTGTCVDYSVSATTLIRKIGFSSDQIMTVEASNHAYNLIRLDLDKKYTIFDMTGNNEGLKLGKVPSGYEYCKNIINCYNDLGKIDCPSNKNIIGCENVKENIGRKTAIIGNKLKNNVLSLFEKIKAEVLR